MLAKVVKKVIKGNKILLSLNEFESVLSRNVEIDKALAFQKCITNMANKFSIDVHSRTNGPWITLFGLWLWKQFMSGRYIINTEDFYGQKLSSCDLLSICIIGASIMKVGVEKGGVIAVYAKDELPHLVF